MVKTPPVKPMQSPDHSNPNALEDEVMRRASDEFMAQVGGSAPVLDVQPETPKASRVKPAPKSKKNIVLIVGGVVAAAVIAGVALTSGSDEPPPSPLMAEIEAASRNLPAQPPEETPPPAAAPQVSEPEPAVAASEAPAQSEPLAPSAPSEGAGSTLVATPAELALNPSVAPPTEALPTGDTSPAQQPAAVAASPAAPPPVVAPPAPPAADSAEVINLRAKVRALESAAVATTRIEVAEVLEDGVVLRDAAGRTVVVPQGGEVTARSGRVEGR
jgi:hypothetical protein